MKGKRTVLVMVLSCFLLMSFVSAFSANTSSYSIGSYHTGSVGGLSATTNYAFRSTTTYQQGGNDNANTTSYDFNAGWFGNASAISFVLPVTLPAPTPTSSGGGGGGGRCINDPNYDWNCGFWSECINGEQTRTCNEFNNCRINWSRPNVTRTCVRGVSPEELFDIRMELEETLLSRASDLEAIVSFFSFGTIPTSVDLTYIILDKSDVEVYRETGDITVITQEILRKTFEGLELPDGEYVFVLNTLYGDDVFDEFSQSFEIRTEPSCELFGLDFGKFIFCWYWWLLLLLGLLAWAIIYLLRKWGKKILVARRKRKGLPIRKRRKPGIYEYVYKQQFRKSLRIRNIRVKYKKPKVRTLEGVKKLKGG
jgi:hypothetical protein